MILSISLCFSTSYFLTFASGGKDLCRKWSKTQGGDAITSDSERTTGDVVRETIERDGAIRIGLARGLINARALARYIQIETRERYSFEAILSAVRRYPVKGKGVKHRGAEQLVSKLALKNKIAVATIKNSPELPVMLAELSKEVDYGRGETYRVISGPESVFVVIDSKNLARITSAVSKSSLLMTLDNLAEIVATESGDALMTPGVLAGLATELAINGVNLVACAAPPTSAIFIMKEEDAMSAYRAIERLSRR